LIERYPENPRVEQAHYHAGVLLSEQAHAASAVAAAGDRRAAARIDQALKDAADTFKRITEEFPKSPYAGDAYVRQIDIVLEWMFDLDKAIAITEKAIAWVKQVKPEQSPSTLGELPAWAMTAGRSHNISINQHAFEIYVKAGLVAHLQGRNDQAIAMFREANKFDPSLRRQCDAETAMDRMISVVQGHRPSLSPQELLDKLRQEQRTAVLLADLALLTFDPQRAESLYDRLLTGQSPFPAPSTELEAYLLLRMGQAL